MKLSENIVIGQLGSGETYFTGYVV